MLDEAAYDRIASNYDQWVSGNGLTLADEVFAELVGVVHGEHVCAVACGAGRETRYLAERGAIVTGVDLSEKLIEIARGREAADPQGIVYLTGNAHNLEGLANRSFDGIVCYMALMDIPRLDLALSSITRVLKSGGWFVFAITHPCFKPPAYGELMDHVDGSVRRTVGRYFDEGLWDGPGKNTCHLPARAYHRTLSTYVNALSAAGLTIQQMREPKLDTPVWREVACLLYVRCQKTT